MGNLFHSIPQPIKGFIFSLIVCLVLMPLIIKLIRRGNWVDKPDGRKVHKKPIPTMGGIVIFLSMFIVAIARPVIMTMDIVVILGSSMLLFFTGIIDDLRAIRPRTKFYIQIVAALVVIFYGIRINNLEVIGLGNFGWLLSLIFTTLCIVFFINAFNLIDGIDGLAGGLSIISLTAFSVLFYFCGEMDYAFLAAALAGSCLGFLFFNFNPARIFMGDTGSLTIGFFLAVFSIEALKLPQSVEFKTFTIDTFSVTFALVLLPSLDAARVFFNRILKGYSPFKPDKTHIHHMLLDVGMSHKTASITLYSAQILLLLFAFFTLPALILIIILTSLIGILLIYEVRRLGLIGLLKNKVKKVIKKTDQIAHSN